MSVAPPSAASSARTQKEAYVTTYYPDATDLSAATPVELSASAQVRGLEIWLQRVSIFKVSGKVVNAATGEAGSVDIVTLIRQGSEAPGLSARTTGVSAGEFSFDGVLPGNYILETKPGAETDGHPLLVGRQIISVGDGDLDRVVVEMKTGIDLSGRVVVEGAPVSSWPQITLTPTDGLNYLDSPMVDADGRFTLTGLEPAPYSVFVGSIPPPMYVKSVRFNGHDVSGEIDLASAPTASLEIVAAYGTSSISGMVSDSEGPAVIVIATRRNQPPYRVTQTDENGRFSFVNLPPGEYAVVAVDSGLGRLPPPYIEKLGKAITVGDDGKAAVDIRLTTTDDLRAADLR